MTVSVSRLPLSLDPLIREAKRRARQRRVLVAVAAVIVLGGGTGGAILASASSFMPTRSIWSALGGEFPGYPVAFQPERTFAVPLVLRNEAGQTITVERVRAVLSPRAPLAQVGTAWSTYVPYRCAGDGCIPLIPDEGLRSQESPLQVPLALRPGQYAHATLSFRLGSCRAAAAAHVPTISSPPLRHLPKRGPRLSKITVVYRTPNGATILQSISSPFSVITFFRLRHMNCSYVAGRICACR